MEITTHRSWRSVQEESGEREMDECLDIERTKLMREDLQKSELSQKLKLN